MCLFSNPRICSRIRIFSGYSQKQPKIDLIAFQSMCLLSRSPERQQKFKVFAFNLNCLFSSQTCLLSRSHQRQQEFNVLPCKSMCLHSCQCVCFQVNVSAFKSMCLHSCQCVCFQVKMCAFKITSATEGNPMQSWELLEVLVAFTIFVVAFRPICLSLPSKSLYVGIFEQIGMCRKLWSATDLLG